jgi:transposase
VRSLPMRQECPTTKSNTTSLPTVLLWRKRYQSESMAGILEDRPRSGRPKRISENREAACRQGVFHRGFHERHTTTIQTR